MLSFDIDPEKLLDIRDYIRYRKHSISILFQNESKKLYVKIISFDKYLVYIQNLKFKKILNLTTQTLSKQHPEYVHIILC